MKIVIDIPEEKYVEIKGYRYSLRALSTQTVIEKAIKNGKPLPKGHGKLVDIEDVKDNIRRWKGYLDEDMMARINFTMDNNIPTIIEADKEMEE